MTRTAVATTAQPKMSAVPAAQPEQTRRISILETVAQRYGMDPKGFQSTLMNTVFRGASNEEFAALLVVANEYRLNPLTKEIYAFKGQGGGIVPLVSIDGWLRIMNEHPQFDGIEYQDIPDDKGSLLAIECTIYRKDRSRPIKVIEYLSECKQNTKPWQSMPARMLRHKATIQCARYAFGFSGIFTEDDVELMMEARRVPPPPPMRDATQRRAIAAPNPEYDGPRENVDPETGEISTEEPDEETARELDRQGFAAMEGRDDADMGEQHHEAHSGADVHPAEVKAQEICEVAGRAETIIDVKKLRERYAADITAMQASSEELAARVLSAFADAERRTKRAPQA